jgi:hypothetical protein
MLLLVAVQRKRIRHQVRRIKGLLPVLANEEDGLTHELTHEDQVEQQGSQAAFGPLREICWRQERENRTEAALTRKTSKRTLDT